MRSLDEVERVMALVASGVEDGRISHLTGVPRSTIRDWRRGRRTATDVARRHGCVHPPGALPSEQYAYLLGMYLGDGHISRHPRGVWKLRVTCDTRYAGIIDAVGAAMTAVRGGGEASFYRRRQSNCGDVYLYWKHWPCVFPQHGPGPNHAGRSGWPAGSRRSSMLNRKRSFAA